jgi:tetratricopeptide (TPR) repeat protein
VLNLAAVIGRSFTFDLLEASTRMDSERLLDGLEEVEGAGLISSSVQYPEARFRFSHELLRKAVLGDLSAARRQRFHLDVADAMERLYPDRLEDHANDLAFHLWQAGNASDAGRTIGYLAMAARREREQGACDAALGRLKNALELLAGLPHTAARDRRELSLLNDLALAAMAAKGYAAPEVATAYGRGRELCRRVGDSSERFRTLLGLCAFFFVRGDFRAARETAEQALAQARIRADPEFLMRANHVMGCALLYCGEICAARAHLEAGLRLCDPKALGEPTIPYEQDPGIAMRAFLGWALFLLGYPDQALKAAKEALTLAKALSHPMSEAFALSHLVRVHLFRREWPIAHSLAATLIALATDQGLPLFVIGGRMLQTWALAELGRGEEAVRRIRQDWPSWQGTGAGLESLAIVATARVYGESGRIKAALQTIESLTPLTMASGDRLHDAELSRLKGELLLRSGDNLGDSASAERGFLSAIEIARRQQARSAELRASISLARLWRSTGDAGRARQLLSQIYGWFGEGFDTPDLLEARSMLAELC